MLFSCSLEINSALIWDLCPSYNSNTFLFPEQLGTCVRKCWLRNSLNTLAFDQPESDMTIFVPGNDPFNKSGLDLLPLKIRNGGSTCPEALEQLITVVVYERGDVTAWALDLLDVTILVGLCSELKPVSSALNI